MVDVSYQMVLSTLQTVGLLVGIFYYVMTLRNTRINQKHALKTRKVQLYMQLLHRFSSEENRLRSIQVQQMDYTDYDDYFEKWGMFKDPESAAKRFHVWTELDGIGQLLREGLIDLDFIPRIIHGVVINQWEKWGQLTIERRKRIKGEEDMNVDFEYLYNEVMKYRDQNPELAT